MVVTDTLAYCDTATITVVKGFAIQAQKVLSLILQGIRK
jgi:hypothetical protein